jgi:ferritin
MQPHVRNYFKFFGYDESSEIGCEVCNVKAVDIHHVEPRSSFGSTRKFEQDHISNLVALCRHHHDLAHGPLSKEFKVMFKQIIENR